MKSFLLIGGFDNTCGAGIIADCKIAHSLNFYPYAITPVIAIQNSSFGFENFPLPIKVLKLQLESIFYEAEIEFCKIGMVGSPEIATFLADFLSERNVKIILDTPLKASNGFILQSPEIIKILAHHSFLITPNREEFLQLPFLQTLSKNILIKSFLETETEIFDKLILDENEEKIFSSKKINLLKNIRGTGCSLASAICTFLLLN